MKESNLNTLIKQNFQKVGGFADKIPDPMFTGADGQRFNLKRPFDGFAVLDNFSYFYETKMLKGYQAFPFQKLSEHQITNLCLIKRNSIFACPMIIVGVYLLRVGFDLFFFKPNMEIWEKRCSATKSQLEEFKAKGFYLPVRKSTFAVHTIPAKIIELRPYTLNGKPRVEMYFDNPEDDDYVETILKD